MMLLLKITKENYHYTSWYSESVLVRCEKETDIAKVGEIGMLIMDRDFGDWKIKFRRGGEGLKFLTIVVLLKIELEEGNYAFYHLEFK
jgi:hypothetical protein